MSKNHFLSLGIGVGILLVSVSSYAGSGFSEPLPCSPSSEFAEEDFQGVMQDLGFCSAWNPEFVFNGHHCCKRPAVGRKRRAANCSPWRRKSSYCDEMTEDQKAFSAAVADGKVQDVLTLLTDPGGRKGEQSYCAVNSGFLAWGRQIIPSDLNRVALRTPGRCTNFGTDGMATMIEWVGRQVSKEYAAPEYEQVKLLIGDVSAPRGGCLAGKSGRKGHASHMTGQDADIGFLWAKPHQRGIAQFVKQFDSVNNWWLIKQFFKNPSVCVKVIFLDHRLIASLARAAKNDPDWAKYHRFIRHMPGHRNHFHVRVGSFAGEAGCMSNPDLEEEDTDLPDSIEMNRAQPSLLGDSDNPSQN